MLAEGATDFLNNCWMRLEWTEDSSKILDEAKTKFLVKYLPRFNKVHCLGV